VTAGWIRPGAEGRRAGSGAYRSSCRRSRRSPRPVSRRCGSRCGGLTRWCCPTRRSRTTSRCPTPSGGRSQTATTCRTSRLAAVDRHGAGQRQAPARHRRHRRDAGSPASRPQAQPVGAAGRAHQLLPGAWPPGCSAGARRCRTRSGRRTSHLPQPGRSSWEAARRQGRRQRVLKGQAAADDGRPRRGAAGREAVAVARAVRRPWRPRWSRRGWRPPRAVLCRSCLPSVDDAWSPRPSE
jgi:hypothetical protein